MLVCSISLSSQEKHRRLLRTEGCFETVTVCLACLRHIQLTFLLIRSNICFRAVHCIVCDVCIERYDHHCTILNNCIGSNNYLYFLVFVISCSVLSAFFIFSNLFPLINLVDGLNVAEEIALIDYCKDKQWCPPNSWSRKKCATFLGVSITLEILCILIAFQLFYLLYEQCLSLATNRTMSERYRARKSLAEVRLLDESHSGDNEQLQIVRPSLREAMENCKSMACTHYPSVNNRVFSV